MMESTRIGRPSEKRAPPPPAASIMEDRKEGGLAATDALWWRRSIKRWIKSDDRSMQLTFEIVPDAAGLIINGTHYLTLSQAMLCFGQASGGNAADGFATLFNGLVDGTLPALLRAPAPRHADPRMAGDVTTDLAFWKRVWWPGFANGNEKPSDEWVAWLLAGGVLVSLEALASVAEPIAEESQRKMIKHLRTTLFQREGLVRNEFPRFWPTTDVLAWIIARDDPTVRRILDSMHPLAAHDPVPPWVTLDEIAAQHCKPGQEAWQVLREAADDLAENLHMERITAKEWPLSGKELHLLGSADFDRARFMHGTNSAGLLGGDFVGRVNHYVLMRPADVKALWKAKAESGTEMQRDQPDPRWTTLQSAVERIAATGPTQSEVWEIMVSWLESGRVSARVRNAIGPYDGGHLNGPLEPMPLDLCARLADLDGTPWADSTCNVQPPYDRYAELDDDYGQPISLTGLEVATDSLHLAIAALRPPTASRPANTSSRAPAVKTGWPPDDDAIVAKALDMKARGMRRDEIASKMRMEVGFENVATSTVRDLIKGKLGRGRPTIKRT